MKPMSTAFLLMVIAPQAALAHEVIHRGHDHIHAAKCGHTAIEHEGHVDYLHDAHLHAMHGGHADEHVLAVSTAHPATEALVTAVAHEGHAHDAKKDDHPLVQHGDHFDHLHDGRLHYTHGDHVDDHGPVALVN
jgi:hypothetical protein